MSTQRITDVGFSNEASSIFINDSGKLRQATVADLASVFGIPKRAPAIIQTRTGETVVANDSSSDPFAGLNIYGKSTQETTTGKNLLPNTATTQTVNGVTFTVKDDGTVTANGTATANAVFRIGVSGLTVGKSYTLNGCPSGGSTSIYFMQLGSFGNDTGSGVTNTVTASTGTSVAILVMSGVTVSNITFKPMIRLASITDATYEPYTGGIAAPNPDYPMTIESSGDDGSIEVGVYGKNLMPSLNEGTFNGVTITKDVNGVYHLSGTATAAVAQILVVDKPSGTYTISINCSKQIGQNSSDTIFMACRNKQNEWFKAVYAYDHGYNTFTANENVYDILFAINNGVNCDGITIVPQLELGSVSTDYEPYTAQALTVSIPNNLCGIPVTDASIANYTDDNGQMWVCDEVDFEKGVYVQRVKSYTFVGSSDESWGYQSTNASGIVRMRTSLLVNEILYNDLSSKMSNLMCNMFKAVSPDSTYLRTQGISVDGNGGIACYTDNYNTTDSVEAFKTHLSSSPMTVLYVLATPIETALTAEQIAEYKALRSNYPNTTVMNDSGAGMGVKTVTDTKIYIDNKFAELAAQIV